MSTLIRLIIVIVILEHYNKTLDPVELKEEINKDDYEPSMMQSMFMKAKEKLSVISAKMRKQTAKAK